MRAAEVRGIHFGGHRTELADGLHGAGDRGGKDDQQVFA